MYKKYESKNQAGARIKFNNDIDKLLEDVKNLREYSPELNKLAFNYWKNNGMPKITVDFLNDCLLVLQAEGELQ